MAEQPDFEKMTPDEIMAWMETLAKRQGATEGFTTAADLDIPEVDPDTVVIDEPGYIPYSEARAGHPLDDTMAGSAAPAEPPPAAASTTPPAPARPSAPPPATPPSVRPPAPAWSAPPRAAEPAPPEPAPEAQGSLAWLESLAQQNEDTLFNLDLSGLGEESEEAAATDPAKWLEAIAATPELQRIAGVEPEPDEDTGSLLWLESLARRQGAPTDELTTPANLELDELPEEPEAPAYTPFSFDTSPTPRSATPAKAADPASFLGSLAASEGYSEAGVLATRESATNEPAAPGDEGDIEEIKRAISEGRVTSDQIHTLFEHQADIAATLPPGADELDLDANEPLVPADVPDWLLEQVEVEPEPPPRTDVPPLESLFEQPIEQAIPDWLKDEADDDGFDLQDIFAEVEAPTAGAAPAAAVEVNPTDPWVEALDLEHSQGLASVEAPPEWYLQNVSDPQRVAAVEGTALSAEALPPEPELPAGQPQPAPDWIAAEAPAPTAAPSDEGVPEWLLEMENIVTSSEIPAWLNEPVDMAASDELPFELEEAPPTPEFIIDVPAPPAEPEPAVEPVTPAAGPSLASARERRQSGDVAGALTEYEALIRTGDSLQDCVDDLAHVARLDRDNPVVYRVLGDGYMRLGKLQLALDTYRQALNHL